MSYQLQNFKDGGILAARHLNKIEEGIVANEQKIAQIKFTGGLPTVTESDNGKILAVVNGVWSAVSVPSAEGVSF